MEEDSQAFVYFTILEKVFSKEREHRESSRASKLKEKIWKNLPEDLQHMVLLWLPAASQARLSRVCRRWRKLMKSASFRERTAEIAWKSGGCTAIFSGKQYQVADNAFKVHRVSLDTFPSDFPHNVFGRAKECQWLSHGGVLAVAVEDENTLRVCVLDLANESWQELPRLVLALPCAELGDPRSWEACMYDAAYDLQQRKWSYKVFASWVRQLGDDDEDDEEYEDIQPRKSFHVYSSITNSWTVFATALEPLYLLAARTEPVLLLDYVVGQGKTLHIYAKGFIGVNEDEGNVDAMRFSREGRVIETLPVVQVLPEWGSSNSWPILLDASLTPLCVFPNCTIYKCTCLQWTKITSLPEEIRAKMGLCLAHEEGGIHHDLANAYMVDPIIFLDVDVFPQRGDPVHHVLAYHMVEDSWEWIARHSSPWYKYPTRFLSTYHPSTQ